MITKSPARCLLLAGLLSVAGTTCATAGETANQLKAEAERYAAMAAEQESLGKHHRLLAASGAKGGLPARAVYHDRLATGYRDQAQAYARRARELDAGEKPAAAE